MNILIVDDEKDIADLIDIYLKNEGFITYKYYDSKNVFADLAKLNIDLAILDIMMPDVDGLALCSKIREKYTFPIIFVTAKVESIDKINGLMLGADDYITKPFIPLELVARVKAQLRRFRTYNNDNRKTDLIDFRGIAINNRTHEFFFHNKKINLTPIEFKILWYLCNNRGIVVTTDELFKNVWDEKYYKLDNNTIMVHIRHLREKMNDTGKNPKYRDFPKIKVSI